MTSVVQVRELRRIARPFGLLRHCLTRFFWTVR
jgi:hypothetical protein